MQEVLGTGTLIVGSMCQTAYSRDPDINDDKELEKVLKTLQDCKARLESRPALTRRATEGKSIGSSGSQCSTGEFRDYNFASTADLLRRNSDPSTPSLALSGPSSSE